MVTQIKQIQEILNCSKQYAQKVIDYAGRDEDKLNYQIERQLYKQANNQAILEVKPHKENRGSKLKQNDNHIQNIQNYNFV
ncbi:hypothetical protein [Staphylococcus ureilyticus]|uniref:hypothetical protein n=1 Tax=Staphylococcus ureilyticus TaxID=94138 RepID=UPI0021D3A31B|nr:hypothetical protein [Staphylococcus ureilyticus]UXS60995.1 hypothetical protein MUA21_05205 [Staphylococcus ureilyticus]